MIGIPPSQRILYPLLQISLEHCSYPLVIKRASNTFGGKILILKKLPNFSHLLNEYSCPAGGMRDIKLNFTKHL